MNLEPGGNGSELALNKAPLRSEAAIEPYNSRGRVFQHLRAAVRGSRATG
jgi:hypothetical protein